MVKSIVYAIICLKQTMLKPYNNFLNLFLYMNTIWSLQAIYMSTGEWQDTESHCTKNSIQK